MALHITPDIMCAAYELLRSAPPFKAWKLPPGEEVEFHVTSTKQDQAEYCKLQNDQHVIRVSYKRHKSLHTLILSLAHEMIHLREEQLKVRRDVAHGKIFNKLADQVCKVHNFDRGQF